MAIGLYFFIHHIAPLTKRLSFLVSLFSQVVIVAIMLTISFFFGVVGIDSVMNRSSPMDPLVWTRASQFFSMPPARAAYFITLGAIFSMLLVWQLGRKLGGDVLTNWITGHYHKPREEERIFMFLDIRNSTTLAERLGHLQFSALIQEFFYDMTTPIQSSRGAVSHYIGDEAVLTWKLKDGLRDGNCIHFFFWMEEEIQNRAHVYREKFALVPEFKAGVHVGRVVACEVGHAKSEVVYLGDVMNTTARIQGLCDSLGAPLLVSKDLVDRLGEDDFQFDDKGPQPLKGKEEPVTVCAVAKRA